MRPSVAAMPLIFLAVVASADTQNCDYPWTVAATPVDSQSAAVHLCGSWIGCAPHDPQFLVTGNQIEVLLIASEINRSVYVSRCTPRRTRPFS